MGRKQGCYWIFCQLGIALLISIGSIAYAAEEIVALNLKTEWQNQFSELKRQIDNRDALNRLAHQTFNCESLIDPGDRDPVDVVVRRTCALLDDIKGNLKQDIVVEFQQRIEEIIAAKSQIDISQSLQRYAVYLDICQLRRDIAFQNPLLDFDKLLFIKRHRSVAPDEHMCDQFYGCFACAGGGLFELRNPFSDKPSLRDILRDSQVERGRLAGKCLAQGSFLSPDLSYDGRSILFAYTENNLMAKPKNEPFPENDDRWTNGRSYHLFKVDVDGSNLEQLTDGTCNDFDPCWLPSGRIAFISERRGGFLRCGFRPCPVYTLHSMNADGRDIVPLSFHETHEWHPSVNHDGMIVYTRWDYVDRDTNVAHHPWITTPDGRDARALQGNYPTQRQLRPWMEMDIRAIPGSHKYVATSAPHHGQAYGSLVICDPTVNDDGAMAPLKRLTPEIPFPEAEYKKQGIRPNEVYATAWPLSEDYHLCAYDPQAENYGVYLIDSFGNRILLYRDESIPCLSPMPLMVRTKPPVLPHKTSVGKPDGVLVQASNSETIHVVNVYDSQFEWPEATRITDLRIIQVLPKTTPTNNVPRIGVASQTNARAVLGTVPVEKDGSVYFKAPVNKPIYFQALNKDGLAIQSMRSLTYVHKGETLSCQGCHESRYAAPQNSSLTSLALRRAPSIIKAEVDGSNPFNYPRLVQSVLDKNCVDCHAKHEKAPNLSGVPGDDKDGYTPSYRSLAEKYGFYFNVSNGSFNDPHPIGGARTVAGQFGAQASKLYQMLKAGHHDVQLSKEDMHRITLWLDCNSDFYGSYENTLAQSRGEVVFPILE